MNKKLLTAAILAAMTLSTASVFANPSFSGDAKIEYTKNENIARDFYSQIRLNVDADLDNDFYVHARAVMKDDVDKNDNDDVTFDQAYLGMKLANADVKAGKQSLFLGKGLLADADNLSALSLGANFAGTRVFGFVGKDNELTTDKKDVRAVEIGSKIGVVNVGASYLDTKTDKNTYYALNADTKIADNVVLNTEYVKNDDQKADGYLAEVKFGNAVKKGDMDYYVSYRNIENQAVSEYSTEENYNDSKGFKVGATYKVTNNAALEAYYDFAEDKAGKDKNETQVKFSVNF